VLQTLTEASKQPGTDKESSDSKGKGDPNGR
jgi:hypothetical protein